MGSRNKGVALSSAFLMASGAVLVLGTALDAKAVTLQNTGVVADPSATIQGCPIGPGTNGAADFIDNADPTVVRFQPRECSILNNATPSFSWAIPKDLSATAKTYTITVTKKGSTTPVKTLTGIAHPWINLTSQLANHRLAAGTYFWSVSYKNTSGLVKSSRTRWFQVPSLSTIAILPSGAEVVNKAVLAGDSTKKYSLKMLPSGASFAAIANLLKTGASAEYKNAYLGLMRDADAQITSSGTPLPAPSPNVATGGSLNNQMQAERGLFETLALAYYFNPTSTKAAAYKKAALDHLRKLALWDVNGISSQNNNDQANREIMLALAEGLDFFRGGTDLSSADITNIATPLKARICQIFNENNCTSVAGFDSYPNDSHKFTAIKYVTQALLHVAGMSGFPGGNSQSMLSAAWEYYLNSLIGFATDDGSFGNGVAYGWYNMEALVPSLAAARVIGKADLSQQLPVYNIGKFLINMTAPNIDQMNAIGDGADTTSLYRNGTWDSFKLLSALIGKVPGYEWYWRARSGNLSNQVSPSLWNYMTLGMNNGGPIVRPSPVMPTGTSALFENTGIVAMHSANTPGWNPDAAVADTYRSSVFFHSSRFGSFNHSHAAQNSFELTVNGVNLLINSGYYVNYDTDYQKLAVRATRYKNALTFDNGIGQAEPTDNSTVPGKPLDTMLTSGKLTNYYQSGPWTVATGNAKNAYRALSADKLSWTPLLTNAIRTVAYNRVDKVLVIYDYATSDVARQWELNFHSTGGYTDKNYNMITLNAKDLQAKACMAIVNLEGTFDTWAGFGEEPPITGTDPHDQQFHARYRSKYKTKALAAMTIIRENCAGGSRPAKVTDPATNPTRMQIQMADGSILYFDKDKVELPN